MPQTYLDTAAGLRNTANNQTLYSKVLKKFLDQQESVPEAIRDALQAGDLELALRLVHTLKGLAATIGGTVLHEAASITHDALKNHDASNFYLDELREAMDNTVAVIRAIVTS